MRSSILSGHPPGEIDMDLAQDPKGMDKLNEEYEVLFSSETYLVFFGEAGLSH